MYQNIGKKIRILAVILAVLSAVGFLAVAAVFLLAALKAEAGTSVRTAGFEGAGVFLALAVLSPLYSWVLYGFGSLTDAAERQVEENREIRDILKKALSDGALSDEIARKLGNSLSKLTVAAPAPRSGVAPTRPVVRGSVKPAEAARPVAPAPATQADPAATDPGLPFSAQAESGPTAETAPAPAQAPAQRASETPDAEPTAPAITFAAPSAAKHTAPVKNIPEEPGDGVTPIRPLHSNTTY